MKTDLVLSEVIKFRVRCFVFGVLRTCERQHLPGWEIVARSQTDVSVSCLQIITVSAGPPLISM